MKRYSVLFFVLLTFLYSCKDKDLQDEVNELKEKVATIEQGKTVTAVEFQGTSMVLTFNTGETTTTPMPTGLNGTNGTNGTNGADGTGIKTVEYSEETGILKITLTNNNVSEFKVVSDSTGLKAVLISDVKGAMLVKSIRTGAIPVAEFTYDAAFNTTSVVINQLEDGKVYKISEMTKEYTNNSLTAILFKSFYTDQGPNIKVEYRDLNGDGLPDDSKDTICENKGSYFYKSNGDGTFRFYEYNYQNSATEYSYRVYPIAVKKVYTNSSYPYEYIYKPNSTTAYRCYETYSTNSSYNNYEVWYYADAKYTKTGTHNIGDVKRQSTYKIECNASGKIEKIYENSSDPQRYLQLNYNALGLVEKSQEYVKNGSTWEKTGNELAYVYNSKNLVDSVKRIYPDKSFSCRSRFVYDKNGNPTEIYAYMGKLVNDIEYYDPIDYPMDPWRNEEAVTKEAGLRLAAKIEYDYAYKNFLGHSISAFLPGLENYKMFNAIKRISHAESLLNASFEYKDFNDKGYPETIVMDTYDDEMYNIRLEGVIEYTGKQ